MVNIKGQPVCVKTHQREDTVCEMESLGVLLKTCADLQVVECCGIDPKVIVARPLSLLLSSHSTIPYGNYSRGFTLWHDRVKRKLERIVRDMHVYE